MLTILVACKEPKSLGGLEHVIPYRVIYSHARPWGAAANELLAQADDDVLFLDDDVTLTEGSLEGVYTHYHSADLFGLDLHVLSTGDRQAGARHTWDGRVLHDWVHPGPAYVAHVSTSAIYIKHTALGVRFPEWTGIHWEDVAFCFDAWRQGLKVMAVPGKVLHDIEGGAGATKRHDDAFWAKWGANKAAFDAWYAEWDLSAVPRDAVGV